MNFDSIETLSEEKEILAQLLKFDIRSGNELFVLKNKNVE